MSRPVRPTKAVCTYPITVVGFLFGIGRNAAYDAAADGIFQPVRVRGRVVAIAAPINRMLELSGPGDPRVQEAYRLAGLTPPPLDDREAIAPAAE